jgi:hypothetical protein
MLAEASPGSFLVIGPLRPDRPFPLAAFDTPDIEARYFQTKCIAGKRSAVDFIVLNACTSHDADDKKVQGKIRDT